MTWITELINNISELIKYIAPGFLLANCFAWITQKKFSSASAQIVTSVVLSYFVWTIGSPLFSKKSPLFILVIISLCCCIIGLVIGKFYKSNFFNELIGRIRLDRTTNESIIEDAIGNNSWVSFYDVSDKKYYCGQFRFGNTEGDANYISIVTYYIMDENKTVLEDYRHDNKRQLLFDMNKVTMTVFSPEDPYPEKILP